MNFIKIKDPSKMGLISFPVGDKQKHAVSYEGNIVTRLFNTEKEATEAAAHHIKCLASSTPISGVLGFNPNKKVKATDRIAVWQVFDEDGEQSIVVGTESGGFEEVLLTDIPLLQDKDIYYGMKVFQLFALYSNKLEQYNKTNKPKEA